MIHLDFEFFLVVATLVAGVVWLIDACFWAKGRRQASIDKTDPILVEYAKSFFPVLLVVLVLRVFIYEPFRIPSGSMMPTLLVGDFILVNKYTYGLRLPVMHTKITDGHEPERGDVAVFRFPEDESLDYIKRIIGLPGDHIQYNNRRLTINGKPLKVEFQHVYQGLGELSGLKINDGCDYVKAGCLVYTEEIDDIRYTTMNHPTVYRGDGGLVVPPGHYFVMGDNRDHSNDSRFWGFVPEQNLVGKAVMIWMHWDWRSGGTGLEVSRIGTKISN